MKLLAQVGIDGCGTLLTGTHGQDDGGSAGNGIAAGEDALPGGHLVLIDDEAALLVGLQAGGGGADQGVGAGAQSHDDGIHVHVQEELRHFRQHIQI